MLTLLTASTAFSQEGVPPSSSAQQGTAPGDDMKSKVLDIPPGAFVEVRLISGVMLQGQLGDVVDEGFVLRTVRNNRVANLLMRFGELRSVRAISNPYPRNLAFDRHYRRTRRVMAIAARGHRGLMAASFGPPIVSFVLEAVAMAR
jgi:hypothetical protein